MPVSRIQRIIDDLLNRNQKAIDDAPNHWGVFIDADIPGIDSDEQYGEKERPAFITADLKERGWVEIE